jgi:hypothetical protein
VSSSRQRGENLENYFPFDVLRMVTVKVAVYWAVRRQRGVTQEHTVSIFRVGE